jgi:hypothetical protein
VGRDCGSCGPHYAHAIAAWIGAKGLGVLAVSLDIGRCSPVVQVVPDQPASLLPVLSSHLTPHHLPHHQNISPSLAQHHSTSTDASNEITFNTTLRRHNSGAQTLACRTSIHSRHLERFRPHGDLRPPNRSALDSATAFRPGLRMDS